MAKAVKSTVTNIFILLTVALFAFWAGTMVNFEEPILDDNVLYINQQSTDNITKTMINQSILQALYNKIQNLEQENKKLHIDLNKARSAATETIPTAIQSVASFNISDTNEINRFLQSNANNLILDLPKNQSRDIYMNYHNMFCNGCDFAPIWSMVTTLCENNLSFSMFVVGANDGGSIKNILKACQTAHGEHSNAEIYGFEAIPMIYKKCKYHMKPYRNVHIFNYALSNENNKSVEVHSDLSGKGGIHSKYKHDTMVSRGIVETRTFDYLLKDLRDGDTTDYVIIDVEGFEVNVVKGMNLEENYMKFPMFQVELGGTWVDRRHATNWTQGDMAKYLEELGYILFLMGGDLSWTHWIGKGQTFDIRGCPKLLRVYSDMFYNKKVLRCNRGRCKPGREHVQGNLLAVHVKYIREEIKNVIYMKLKQLQLEVFEHMKYVNYSQPKVRKKYIH